MNTYHIVIIEDNEFFNQLVTTRIKNYMHPICANAGMELKVDSYTDGKEALHQISGNGIPPNIILLDYYLGDEITGMDLMKGLQKVFANQICIIIMSQVKSLQTSLVTLLEGASDFVLKDKNAITKLCHLTEEHFFRVSRKNVGNKKSSGD